MTFGHGVVNSSIPRDSARSRCWGRGGGISWPSGTSVPLFTFARVEGGVWQRMCPTQKLKKNAIFKLNSGDLMHTFCQYYIENLLYLFSIILSYWQIMLYRSGPRVNCWGTKRFRGRAPWWGSGTFFVLKSYRTCFFFLNLTTEWLIIQFLMHGNNTYFSFMPLFETFIGIVKPQYPYPFLAVVLAGKKSLFIVIFLKINGHFTMQTHRNLASV